jgi:DNA-binding Xre family transcriptional regulator
MNKADNKSLLVKRIKYLCHKNHDVTSYKVSKNSGMNPSTLNNILNGKFQDIRFSTIQNVCRGLNVSVQEFFDDEIFK